jgi:hypothetical protein
VEQNHSFPLWEHTPTMPILSMQRPKSLLPHFHHLHMLNTDWAMIHSKTHFARHTIVHCGGYAPHQQCTTWSIANNATLLGSFFA